jgi:hypothetical protein
MIHSKAIIMDILKYTKLLFLSFFFISCHKTTYKNSNESFYQIYFRNWNSSVCPKKMIFEIYKKDSNFEKLIKSDSDFEISGCDKSESKFNQRIFTPNVARIGEINYDIKLIVDDSIEYKITEIQSKIDTVYARGHAFVIMNNIKSLVVNGYKLDNKNAPLSIGIPTNTGLVIKN